MNFKKRIETLKKSFLNPLKGSFRGIEREALRVEPNGFLSSQGHFKSLGSSLLHPNITTDFSESQLEFVTQPFQDPMKALELLRNLHYFTYRNIEDELLWPSSMPSLLDEKKGVPMALFGSSNEGRFKHIYRVGLKNRYGTHMQAISGVHYNLSYPRDLWQALMDLEEYQGSLKDFISRSYFSLIRNFHRYGWVLLYFFGASPVLDQSFFKSCNKKHSLNEFDDKGTLFLPYATSLRMSDLGYHNKKQKDLQFCFNSLESFLVGIERAIRTVDEDYARIGVKVNGEYRQLNNHILQIENEYYGPIRPKRSSFKKDRTNTQLLKEEGVEYVELRILDLNPFAPLGIDLDQVKFIDTFLTYCLLKDSPPCSPEGIMMYQGNWEKVAVRGREPGLQLTHEERKIPLRDWGMAIYEELKKVASLFESFEKGQDYTSIIEKFHTSLQDPDYTLSGHLIRELEINHQSYFEFSREKAFYFKKQALQNPPNEEIQKRLAIISQDSNKAQEKMEKMNQVDFDQFLAQYFNS